MYAHQEMQVIVDAIAELKAEIGKPAWDWQPEPVNEELTAAVAAQVGAGVIEAYQISDKMARQDALGALKTQAVEQLANDESGVSSDDVKDVFAKL